MTIKGPNFPGRLAFRKEGGNWNVYYALPDTMEDALFLGSIKLHFVENEKHRKAFMKLMRACFEDLIKEVTGERLAWPEPEGHPAPEHERTKE